MILSSAVEFRPATLPQSPRWRKPLCFLQQRNTGGGPGYAHWQAKVREEFLFALTPGGYSILKASQRHRLTKHDR